MSWRRRAFLGAAILAWPFWPALAATELPAARDLQSEAARAAAGEAPLIILYTRADCHYCKAVRKDFLLPLTRDPVLGQRVVVREVAQDSEAPLQDFQGRTTTHAALAKAEKIKLVPVVAFYGPGGVRLADPIVGARLPDFYQSYLETALEQAGRQLKQR